MTFRILPLFLFLSTLTFAQAPVKHWTAVGAAGFGNRTIINVPAVAGVKHVIDCVWFSGTTDNPPSIGGSVINIPAYAGAFWVRDGDTDNAAPLYVWGLAIPATTKNGYPLIPSTGSCGLHIEGSVGSAITARFSFSEEGVSEVLSISGHDE